MGDPGAVTDSDQKTEASGPIIDRNVPYGTAPLRGVEKTLVADIFRPPGAQGPCPVFVWFHSGAFKGGTFNHSSHSRMARWLTRWGIAVVTPEYRLRATEDDLSEAVRTRLGDLNLLKSEGFRNDLSQARALAAMEDSVRFLHWLDGRREELGLGGRFVLGGSSAGAINAFNMCFTAPYLGIDCPEVGGILSYSGGYAYPSLYKPGVIPVFAAHNPEDDRVSIDTIRQLKAMDPAIDLIETYEQPHGSVKLYENESRRAFYQRMVPYITGMSGIGDS